MTRRLLTALKSVLAFIATFYAVAVGYLYFNQNRLLFPVPPQYAIALPAGMEAVTLTMPDGSGLKSFFADAGPDSPAILFFHGNGMSANMEFERAAHYRAAGYSVLLAEYRGYGGSDGAPSATALKADALQTYDWLATRSGGPVFIVAHSLGTGIAVHVAANRPVKALFLEAGYSSIADVALDKYPFVPVRQLLANPITAIDDIGSLSIPLKFVHGVLDTVIPIRFGQALYDAAPEGARWQALEGAGHNDLAAHGVYPMALDFLAEVRKAD